MGYPALDVSLSRLPIAQIITPSGEMEIYKIKLLYGNWFFIKKYGAFQVDPTKGIKYKKNFIYQFDARSAKPLDLKFMKEIEYFAKHNGLHKITRKDVHQGSRLRQMFSKFGKKKVSDEEKLKILQDLEDEEQRKQKEITNVINDINETIEQKNQKQLDQKKAPLAFSAEEYSDVITETLFNKHLITKEEANNLKIELSRGGITFEEFMERLQTMRALEVHEPIDGNAQLYLEEFGNVSPQVVGAFVSKATDLDKDIEKLGSPIVKNLTPILYIFGIVMVVVIGGVIMSTVDLSNLDKLIPPIPFLK